MTPMTGGVGGGGRYPITPNFERLVLHCVDASDSESKHMFQRVPISFYKVMPLKMYVSSILSYFCYVRMLLASRHIYFYIFVM